MDFDVNSRNYENYVDINGKPVKRVTSVDSTGNLTNPATSDNQTNGNQKTQITTSLINFEFDSVYLTEPDTVTEVYTYKLSGNIIATITIIYTDVSKETLISCIRS
jgi:hypothetical protein